MTSRQLKQIPYLSTGNQKESAELKRLISYIAKIDDALTRRIFELRYIEQCSWGQIAMRIGGGNTQEGVRKRHTRYLKDH